MNSFDEAMLRGDWRQANDEVVVHRLRLAELALLAELEWEVYPAVRIIEREL